MTPTLAVVMVLMGIAIGWMARGWNDLRRANRVFKERMSEIGPVGGGWGPGEWSTPGPDFTVSSYDPQRTAADGVVVDLDDMTVRPWFNGRDDDRG